MTKPYTENDFSDQLDADFTWRIKEFSDLKSAITVSLPVARPVLLRALIALAYAHWEGYAKTCVKKYFDYITARRYQFTNLEDQIYSNYFLARIDALSSQRVSLRERCELVSEIMSSREKRFSKINQNLIDTHSNLNSKNLQELCLVCNIDYDLFAQDEDFINRVLVKRRNEIAHGEEI